MKDLDRYLNRLDQIPVPPIQPRPPSRPPVRDRRGGRWAIVAFSLVLALIVLAWALSVLPDRQVAADHLLGPSPSLGHAVSSTALVDNGLIRCTASFPSDVVFPGHTTGAVYELVNVSDRLVRVTQSPYGSSLVIGRAGSTILDTSTLESGPFRRSIATPLRPGGSTQIRPLEVPIIWPGPLQITPRCLGTTLPPVRLEVANPGRSPADDVSVREAVAAAGAPFASCRPTRINQWVTGVIHRGQPPSDLSFKARCGGLVIENPGFDTVVLAIVSPPDAPSIGLDRLAYQSQPIPSLGVGAKPAIAVSWWVYVVTRVSVQRIAQRAVSQNCEGISGESGSGIFSCRFPTGHA
jgi:hypothetical protein